MPPRPVQVSNRAAQEQHQQVLSVTTPRRHFNQAIQIFALETHNAHEIDIAKLALAHGQGGR